MSLLVHPRQQSFELRRCAGLIHSTAVRMAKSRNQVNKKGDFRKRGSTPELLLAPRTRRRIYLTRSPDPHSQGAPHPCTAAHRRHLGDHGRLRVVVLLRVNVAFCCLAGAVGQEVGGLVQGEGFRELLCQGFLVGFVVLVRVLPF
jgi:hypothetical protein